eukprot:TRINITY_DN3271_c0_g2_i2.p1 TRINITY_DN3271_c0_g2~~TRINITY_DN3271_c0_g2_i2.p1  ORF type:complete len:199 (+),score=20.94 TRINITY_DN3271_c0_g2_i2:260-856(+)
MLQECREAKSAFLRLVIIQVLEASFSSFCVGMSKSIQQVGLFEDLEYFGVKHEEAEEGHSFDDWLHTDEEKLIAQYQNISQQELTEGLKIIDRLFDTFEAMFHTWYVLGKTQLKNTKKNQQFFRFPNMPKQSRRSTLITNKLVTYYPGVSSYTGKQPKHMIVQTTLRQVQKAFGVQKKSKKLTKNLSVQQKLIFGGVF